MAVVLRLSDRRARAVLPVEQRLFAPPAGTAEIVILPCIRHERLSAPAETYGDELPTQRQA